MISVFLRTWTKRSSGEASVYLKLSLNNKFKIYSLKIFIDPKDWDKKKYVKASRPEAEKLNMLISQKINKANGILYDLKLKDKAFGFYEFEQFFYDQRPAGKCFFQFCDYEFKNNMQGFSADTIRGYKILVSKIKKFKPSILLCDINLFFIQDYDKYMRNVLDNNQNTIHRSHRFIRSMINRAIKYDMLKENPYKKFTLRLGQTYRQYLEIKDLNILETFIDKLDHSKRNVLRYFLFACYTGLRYSDMKTLSIKNIIDGSSIKLIMHKTKDEIIIPLCNQALKLICTMDSKDKIFDIYTNQATNRMLKEIMLISEINKAVSFHSARHTFATNSLDIGIPLEVVSRLLGHKDFKTTQIYAHIIDKTKFREMEKWNQL